MQETLLLLPFSFQDMTLNTPQRTSSHPFGCNIFLEISVSDGGKSQKAESILRLQEACLKTREDERLEVRSTTKYKTVTGTGETLFRKGYQREIKRENGCSEHLQGADVISGHQSTKASRDGQAMSTIGQSGWLVSRGAIASTRGNILCLFLSYVENIRAISKKVAQYLHSDQDFARLIFDGLDIRPSDTLHLLVRVRILHSSPSHVILITHQAERSINQLNNTIWGWAHYLRLSLNISILTKQE